MQVVWSSKENLNNGEVMQTSDLVNYFSPDLFLAKLKHKSKAKCLEQMAALFVDSKCIRNGEIVLEMLQQREKLGSTGIGKGVAIPHGRTTATMDVHIAFGKSEKGIEFDAIDKKPVHLVFVVLAPPQEHDNKYLPVLGKLVEFLNETKNRNKLLKAETYEEFVAAITGDSNAE